MIHAIHFANRGGFDLFESTKGFPEEFKEEIRTICNKLVGSKEEHGPALRYMPLKNRYLLTVIFRVHGGNGDEARSHVTAVNFLMDDSDADAFFELPFRTTANNAISVARELEGVREEPWPDNLRKRLLQKIEDPSTEYRSETPLSTLLIGVGYGMAKTVGKQLFLQTREDPITELHNLIRFLPPRLCRDLRFHTDCLNASETSGITICYSSRLDDLLSGDFRNGPDKMKRYWYFSPSFEKKSNVDEEIEVITQRMVALPQRIPLYEVLLKRCITSWESYQALSSLLGEPLEPTLKNILQVLPDQELSRVIPDAPLSVQNLQALKKAAPRKSRVYAAVKKRLDGSQPEKVGRNKPTRKPKEPWQPKAKRPGSGFWTLLVFCVMTLLTLGCLYMALSQGDYPWAVSAAASGVSAGYFLCQLMHDIGSKS